MDDSAFNLNDKFLIYNKNIFDVTISDVDNQSDILHISDSPHNIIFNKLSGDISIKMYVTNNTLKFVESFYKNKKLHLKYSLKSPSNGNSYSLFDGDVRVIDVVFKSSLNTDGGILLLVELILSSTKSKSIV